MRIVITAALLLTLPLPAVAQSRPRGTAGVAMLHAFSVPWRGVDSAVRTSPVDTQFTYFRRTAFEVQPQADQPRILEAAARLASEVRLQQADDRQGGDNRRAVQRIPLPAQIAMVAGGAVAFYLGQREYGDCGCAKSVLVMTGGGAAVGLGVTLMLQ